MGATVEDGARATVEDSVVTRNEGAGILCAQGGQVTVTGSLISHTTTVDREDHPGTGVLVQDDGRLTLRSSAAVLNHLSGMSAAGPRRASR